MLTAFKGATAYEAQVWRVWVRIPFWRFMRLGIWPSIGIDFSSDDD